VIISIDSTEASSKIQYLRSKLFSSSNYSLKILIAASNSFLNGPVCTTYSILLHRLFTHSLLLFSRVHT